jgi:hypothetical protein
MQGVVITQLTPITNVWESSSAAQVLRITNAGPGVLFVSYQKGAGLGGTQLQPGDTTILDTRFVGVQTDPISTENCRVLFEVIEPLRIPSTP